MSVVLERRRTGWDIALGALLTVLGLVVLGNAVIATAVSVLFIGWLTLIGGIVALVGSLFRIGRGGAWFTAITGGLLLALGLMIVNNPKVAAATLTLLAGVIFLAGGITRLFAAAENRELRWVLAISGVVSVALGLLVLFNLYTATAVLLGVLLGIEMVVDGLAMMVVGRLRIAPTTPVGGWTASGSGTIPTQPRRGAEDRTDQPG